MMHKSLATIESPEFINLQPLEINPLMSSCEIKVLSGRILFEAEGVPLEIAQEALRLGAQKLPITTKFIVRRDYVESSL